MTDYHDDINYGKSFQKDPSLGKILGDTSIDDKVTITSIHKNINSLSEQLEKSQINAQKQFKSISLEGLTSL